MRYLVAHRSRYDTLTAWARQGEGGWEKKNAEQRKPASDARWNAFLEGFLAGKMMTG